MASHEYGTARPNEVEILGNEYGPEDVQARLQF